MTIATNSDEHGSGVCVRPGRERERDGEMTDVLGTYERPGQAVRAAGCVKCGTTSVGHGASEACSTDGSGRALVRYAGPGRARTRTTDVYDGQRRLQTNGAREPTASAGGRGSGQRAPTRPSRCSPAKGRVTTTTTTIAHPARS